MDHFQKSIYDLIVETSTNLPADVRKAIHAAQEHEDKGTRSALALSTIAENIQMAESSVSPICQDTGMPTFMIRCPVGVNQIAMKKKILEAVTQATKDSKLRMNSVDSLTGDNQGNVGPGMPVINFEQWERDNIEVRLILKGGGCENKNIQYSLPADLEGLGKAGRDLDGIRKCIMHAVYQAQGQGCGAGFIGVGIGGDRASGYELAKKQLFRAVDDINPNTELRELEEYVMENANKLGIGTMGFGGKVSLLGCKIGAANRLPASFFVSVSYSCWAFRRQGVTLNAGTGKIEGWIYKSGTGISMKDITAEGASGKPGDQMESRREIFLNTPISEDQIRQLKVGDVVVINGLIHTGRDALHKYLMDHDCPVDLNGAVIYHSGPVMSKDADGAWSVRAAGPTTSIRTEPYQGDIIRKFGIRAVIGKGGMGQKTLAALKEYGAVYLNAIGGAAQYYAKCFKKVTGVHFMEFGIPEAMWHLQTEGFTAIVTMDSRGNSLHADVEHDSLEKLIKLKEPFFK
ncbi:fumarate hydratase [Paenibacillus beijingensis]|uniref:Fumarate hydratase class I n=1 Tax=Paenibacillus beijingensis TaxID=1126833 RepID=A0A0D5NK62_9BACL|nr:fumarate hydratase [Paenibacillus beijingensis]AJY75621.1 fumarate hydratase [Paenibacillus beijingensis]